MRRSASEVIRSLEMRIARLERQASNRVASDWKSNSVWVYDEGMTSQRNWIATTYAREVESLLNRAGQDVVSTNVIEHPMHEDMDITIFELDSDDWNGDSVVHSIRHQIDGNPSDRRTLSQIKSMILG